MPSKGSKAKADRPYVGGGVRTAARNARHIMREAIGLDAARLSLV